MTRRRKQSFVLVRNRCPVENVLSFHLSRIQVKRVSGMAHSLDLYKNPHERYTFYLVFAFSKAVLIK